MYLLKRIRDNTGSPDQPNMCKLSHNVPFSAKWSLYLQTYQTDSNKQVLIGALVCVAERGLFECVSCGWSWARAREWGVRLLGFLVTAAWAHLIPLRSPMQPSSPHELCVRGGPSAILASAPCHSLNQDLSLWPSPAFSFLGIFFSSPPSSDLSFSVSVCHCLTFFLSLPSLPPAVSSLISGPKHTLSHCVCTRP